MVLLNKQDVDKINKAFYDLKQLDSLKKLHLEMISCLEIKNNLNLQPVKLLLYLLLINRN